MNITDTDQFLLDAYTGRGGFEDGSYLVAHSREGSEKLTARKNLAVYPNYVKKIVRIYVSYLFKRGAQRGFDDGEVYQNFCQNADNAGTYIDLFLKRAFRLSLILGTVYILVDKPKGQAVTRADQIAQGLFPYAVLRLPKDVSGYELDGAGALLRIRFRETVKVDGENQTHYRTFTRTSWTVAEDAEGEKIVERGDHNLGKVPVVMLHCEDPLTPAEIRANPWIWDIAVLSFDLFNAVSELRELLRNQTFSILTLPVRTEKEANDLADLKISTENALPYNPEGGGKPDYIAPPNGPVEVYQKQILDTIDQIYRLANLEFTGGVSGGSSGMSGVSMAFLFQEANRTMGDFAGQVEGAEYLMAELVYAWEGRPMGNDNISWPRDFSVTDMAQELKLAMDATTMQVSGTFTQQIKKRLARNLLGEGTPDDVLELIDAEIEADDDIYGTQLKNEAGQQ